MNVVRSSFIGKCFLLHSGTVYASKEATPILLVLCSNSPLDSLCEDSYMLQYCRRTQRRTCTVAVHRSYRLIYHACTSLAGGTQEHDIDYHQAFHDDVSHNISGERLGHALSGTSPDVLHLVHVLLPGHVANHRFKISEY